MPTYARFNQNSDKFFPKDFKSTIKTKKVTFYGLLNVNDMKLCHKNAYPSLAGSQTVSSWSLTKIMAIIISVNFHYFKVP